MTLVHLGILAVVAVGSFVFGVLFGRHNSKTVEADIAWIKAEVAKLSGHGSKPSAPVTGSK